MLNIEQLLDRVIHGASPLSILLELEETTTSAGIPGLPQPMGTVHDPRYFDYMDDEEDEDVPVQFLGETVWDAVIHHNSLDIVEEKDFFDYCNRRGIDKEDLSALNAAFKLWFQTTVF